MIRSIALAAFCVAFLMHPPAATAAQHDAHLSSDRDINVARALVQQGRFQPALQILRQFDANHPDRLDILFLIGLAALGAHQQIPADAGVGDAFLNEAIRAFHAMLVQQPGLMRVRLELAYAFFLRESDDLAKQQFELVLAGNPPPVVAANIRRFLETIRARRRFSGSFGVTLAPDTNINNQSTEKTVYIIGLPFQLQSEQPKSGVGVVVSASGEYQQPLGDYARLVFGGELQRTEYPNSDFDRTALLLHTGPALAPVAKCRSAGAEQTRPPLSGQQPALPRDRSQHGDFGAADGSVEHRGWPSMAGAAIFAISTVPTVRSARLRSSVTGSPLPH